ncbi:MAG: hypothetical protein ABSA62_15940 [Methyloceanibacter sp.]
MSLHNARNILMHDMYEGIPPSENIKAYRNRGLHVVDAAQAMAAAKALRQAILAGELDLFALFSSHDTPLRLHNKALIEAALFPSNSTVCLVVIGKMLGHCQPATTARYAHLADDP